MIHYKNVDIMRGIAIITIIVYHCYAITAVPLTHFMYIDKIIGYGGEIGVTLFFILSGFGISCSIINQEDRGNPYTWKTFMQKRFKRILPQYYANIFIMLILTDCASMLLTKNGLVHILSHLLFVHNLFIPTHGSINGAMWTMATIVQFYMIALCLQKLIRKHKWIMLCCSILFTIIAKCIIFAIISKYTDSSGTWFFVYGRQLVASIDNFVVGMVLANVLTKKRECTKRAINWLFVGLCIIGVVLMIISIERVGLYTNTFYSRCWHTLLAVLLGVLLYFVVQCPVPRVFNFFERMLLWVSKYEYGIYIWHIVIIYNLLAKSTLFQILKDTSFLIFTIGILSISCVMGCFSTKFIDKVA